MEDCRFVINTIMTREDYRRFLYFSAFRRKKSTIPLLASFALIGGILIGMEGDEINWVIFLVSWISLFVLAIVIVIFQIERKNVRRIKTDKTGTFGSVNTLRFYDDRVVMENEQQKSTGTLKYEQFYALVENKDYFIFYTTENLASLIRKKDIDDPNAFRDFIAGKFNGRYKKYNLCDFKPLLLLLRKSLYLNNSL